MNSNKPLTNLVYKQIYRDVIDGAFTVNDILSENQLAQRYGVSKSPVREALVTLCDEKVLQSIPRTGYRILQVLPGQLSQIAETRRVLELSMLEKSFPSIGQKEIDLLKAHNKEFELLKAQQEQLGGSTSTPVEQRWRDNVGFHLLLASFAQNEYMSRFLEEIMRIEARATTQYFQHYTVTMTSQRGSHQRLIEACENGDFEAAKRCLIEDTREIEFWREDK